MPSHFSIESLIQKTEKPKGGVYDDLETIVEVKPTYDTDHESSAEEGGIKGPIKQTLSYFDVLLPHIQMICNASNSTLNEGSDSTPSNHHPSRKSQPPGDWMKLLQNSLVAGPSTSSATSFPNGFFFQQVIGNERKTLAKKLSLSETQIKVWFQNRRTKQKRVDTGVPISTTEV